MSKRTFWITMGAGALSVALIALPGISAKKQEIGPATLAQLQEKLQELQGYVSDEAPGSLPGQEDLQVVTNPGGGWLGVGVSEITTDKAKELKLPAERGALLGKIIPDSPAAKAGLKQNDVITEINGQRVEGTAQFRRMIREIPVGRTAQLNVWRDGRSQMVSVTIGKAEPRGAMAMVMPSPGSYTFRMPEVQELPDLSELSQLDDMHNFAMLGSGHPRLGIDAENLEGDFGNYFGAPDGEGVLVRNVFGDSPAARAGMKAGDVITSVNGERIRSVSELREKLGTNKDGKNVKLGLLRNKAEMSVNVEVPAPAKHEAHHLAERTTI
ncbi:MAG TPA: PDZ domain-containing protein [Candidatus Acidoferrum sp.]